MKQRIEALTQKEKDWINSQLGNASLFVATFLPSHADKPIDLAVLDTAFASWIASKPSDVSVINGVINCVGVAFGRALVEGIGFKWVIAIDEHESDLAVYALPGSGDVLVYPANFVARRWERHEANFLERSYREIASQLKALGQFKS